MTRPSMPAVPDRDVSDWDIEQVADAHEYVDDKKCPTCKGTRVIRSPHPTSSAYFPKPDRIYRCLDCITGDE